MREIRELVAGEGRYAVSERVTRIDPADIAERIESSINAYLLSFSVLPGATVHDDARCTWIDSGRAEATLNAVVSTRFGEGVADEQIEAILSHFRQQERPLTWHIGPLSLPPDVGLRLPAHGLMHSEDEPGMALDLDDMREDIRAPELAIEVVRDERGLEEWVSVWLFPVPTDRRRSILDAMRQRGLGGDRPWRLFIGRLGDRPVACAELFVDEGVAALHHLVTLPAARRQGIGTAMTLHVLREARSLGYHVAVLTASLEGIGVYRRIGFREYCWFSRYEWEPGAAGTNT